MDSPAPIPSPDAAPVGITAPRTGVGAGIAEILAMSLAKALDHGSDVPAALQGLHAQGVDPAVVSALTVVLERGGSLAEALRTCPRIFPPAMVQAVAFGEEHRTVAWVYKVVAVAEHARHALARARHRFRRRIVWALAATGIWVALVLALTAKMEWIYRDLAVRVPPLTLLLIQSERLLRNPPLGVLWMSAIISGILLLLIVQRSLALPGRRRLVAVLWRAPFVGRWWRERAIAGLTCDLGLLMACGMSAAQAAARMRNEPGSAPTQEAWARLSDLAGDRLQLQARPADDTGVASGAAGTRAPDQDLITAGWQQLLLGVQGCARRERLVERMGMAISVMSMLLWTVGSYVVVAALLLFLCDLRSPLGRDS